MLLTVGELARRCGLTVRTLHHYDAIGLLVPASRSAAGYRLYARADIERLHRIQALRQLGLSLTDIGTALSGPQRPSGRVDTYQAARAGSCLQAGQGRRRECTPVHDRVMTPACGQTDPARRVVLPKPPGGSAPLDQAASLPGTTRPHLAAWARQRGLLDRCQHALTEVVDRQIVQIDRELHEAARLRERLVHLRKQLADGQSPDLADWLDTLELMTMYEKYFTPDELKELPLHTDPDIQPDWSALVTAVQAAMDRGTTPDDAEAHILALRWMEMIGRGTGNNPAFLLRLRTMTEDEPGMRQRSGITPALERFVEQAIVSARLAIFARYLDANEMQRMRQHYGKQMYAWPELIAELRQAMLDRVPAAAPHVQQMARRWGELFRAYAGDDPATHARIREAYAKEPDLRSGSSVDDALIAYLREATASLTKSVASRPH